MSGTATILAHEWLEQTGGSENTFEQMIAVYPDARVECLWNDANERFPDSSESFLARTPLRHSKALSLPVMREAWMRVQLDGVSRVIASSHAMAHHLAGRAAGLGIEAHAYVYSPPRYLWAPELDARGDAVLARVGRPALRQLDRRGLHPDVHYIGISRFVADRMRRAWGVDADIVYPPVDTERILSTDNWSDRASPQEQDLLDSLPAEFVLGASRLVEYKRLDVAITVGQLLDLPVVIAGAGPFERQLRALAADVAVPVEFTGRVSDAALYALYRRARLFVFMPIEDFGIMPIEALTSGARTLVRDVGGAREVSELLGAAVHADPDHRDLLRDAAFAAASGSAPRGEDIAAHFSVARFRAEFAAAVGQ